jgi:hypothetical protein
MEAADRAAASDGPPATPPPADPPDNLEQNSEALIAALPALDESWTEVVRRGDFCRAGGAARMYGQVPGSPTSRGSIHA